MGQTISKIQVNTFIALIFILIVNSLVYGSQPKWYSKLKQIKPMVTTKQEVENLLGYPKITYTFQGEWNKNVEYELKEGKLSISYSVGKCSERNKEGYNIDNDVVISVRMYLEKEVSIAKLKLNLTDFSKSEISDLVGVFTYRNDSTGEYYNGTSQKISDIVLLPSKLQEKNFKCKILTQ